MPSTFSPRKVVWKWVLVACAIASFAYSWCAMRAYLAYRLSEKQDSISLQRSIALEPQDAKYYDLLGRYFLFVTQKSPTLTVSILTKATELNPFSSSYLLDLAHAYYYAGNRKDSLTAIRRATTVDPTTPDTAWSAANFFLVQGDTQEALEQFKIVLRGEPAMATPVLNICWQSLHDVNLIQSIIPPNPDVYLAFIQLLLSSGEFAPAKQMWATLVQLKQPFDYHLALFYIDSLLTIKAVDDASKAWAQLSSRSHALQAYSQNDDLVKNGLFSEEILNSGFDWRYSPRPHIAVALDTAEFHSATRSLSLTYSDTGSDAGIFEYIAVQPNTSYRLSAWVKSEDLESANGPHLTVKDSSSDTIFGSTEDTIGTTAWHHLETELRTGPQTTLVVLTILRSPSDTRVQGKYWIDDISLRPM
jgi:tetratricopeptide (TPR) repeat protein